MQLHNSSSRNQTQCEFFTNCGGCDFLNLDEQDYQNLKQKFLAEIFTKHQINLSCNIDYHWFGANHRRKITLQVTNQNKVGFFAKKSHIITEINHCLVAQNNVSQLIVILQNLMQSLEQNIVKQIIVTAFDSGIDVIFDCKKALNFSFEKKVINFAQDNKINASYRFQNNLTPLFLAHKNQIFYPNFKINLDSDVFIQATKIGLEKIIELIQPEVELNSLVADIYAGFGAYSFAIVNKAKIVAFEGSEKMVNLIKNNVIANALNHKIQAFERDLFFSPLQFKELNKFDIVIINPPRNGATPQVVEIAKSKVNKIIYISCNPQSFAVDVKILLEAGFKIDKINALDQFYGSKHLELVVILKR